MVVPHLAQTVKEELARRSRRNALSAACRAAAARSDNRGRMREDGDDFGASLRLEMRRDELGDGVVQLVTLKSVVGELV